MLVYSGSIQSFSESEIETIESKKTTNSTKGK